MPTGQQIRQALHEGKLCLLDGRHFTLHVLAADCAASGHRLRVRRHRAHPARSGDAVLDVPDVRGAGHPAGRAHPVQRPVRGVQGARRRRQRRHRAVPGDGRAGPRAGGRRAVAAAQGAPAGAGDSTIPRSLEPELRSYLEKRNADKICIANIESVPAIENLDEIVRVPGLDAVLIGPHDLSCSLGIPEQYTHPRFDEAVRTIFRIARAAGIGAGIHFWVSLDHEVAWSQAGGNLIMHSSDLAIFRQTLKSDIDTLRNRLSKS